MHLNIYIYIRKNNYIYTFTICVCVWSNAVCNIITLNHLHVPLIISI